MTFDDLIESATQQSRRTMLFDFAIAQYETARTQRLNQRPEPPTASWWAKERQELRMIFDAMFGPFPKRCSLNSRVTGTLQRDGYRVEKIMYQSLPGVWITANLYLPDAPAKPMPAIVLACGHAQGGKSYPGYQKLAIDLVRRGMAVLCFDPFSQGERIQFWDFARNQMLQAFEHDVLGRMTTLLGRSLAGHFAFDAMRSIDYLVSRKDIDPQRIGMTGCSGGGTQTTWTAAVDDRVSCAVPICYVSSVDSWLRANEAADSEQNPPGLLQHGLEQADLLAMLAPKPLLIAAAREDFFPITGAADTVAALKKLYALSGDQDKVELFVGPGRHGLSDEIRQATTAWFCRWFGVRHSGTIASAPGTECARTSDAACNAEKPLPAPQPESEADLWVTGSGQLLLDGIGRSLGAYCAQEAARAPRTPAAIDLLKLRKVLGVPECTGEPAAVWDPSMAMTEFDGMTAQAVHLEPEPGIRICGLLFRAAEVRPCRSVVVYACEDGLAAAVQPGTLARKLVATGQPVFVLELRGTGSTQSDAKGWWPNTVGPLFEGMHQSSALPHTFFAYRNPLNEGPLGSEFVHGSNAQMLGRPLLGQRALDFIEAVRALRARPEYAHHPLVLAGSGTAALAALYAAVFTGNSLCGLVLHQPLLSYRLPLAEPRTTWPAGVLVRDILRAGDVPAVLAELSHVPVLVIDPAGAFRTPAGRGDTRRHLGGPKHRHVRVAWTDYARHPIHAVVKFISELNAGERT